MKASQTTNPAWKLMLSERLIYAVPCYYMSLPGITSYNQWQAGS
jgi:hypothetical protein